MATAALDALPGFRRRIVVTPGADAVRAEVEDDYHHMRVALHHDGVSVTRAAAEMIRVPWTTCPGAPRVFAETFTGVALAGVARRGDKPANCTHLHDIALLAAAHAHDLAPLVFDLLVADPEGGLTRAELRRDGQTVLAWALRGWQFAAPAELAGLRLDQLRDWIDGLDPAGQEAARLLRWGTMLAHGRGRANHGFDAAALPRGQCYTFQVERAEQAEYIRGTVRDFSRGDSRRLHVPAAAG